MQPPNAVTVIEPPSGWQLVNVAELWKFRELLGFLVWRDVKVRYKQTLLGAAWAVLQPLLMMIVFTIFFGRMAGVNSGGMPYPLFAFAGLLPWSFFSTAISQAGNSVVGSERLITKIYFPRLAIPFASVGAALVDFTIAFGMMVVLMAWYRVVPTLAILLVPAIVMLITLAALGMGTLLAALNVAYRDFRYVIPFLVQLWMFATPTVYMQPAEYAAPRQQVTADVADHAAAAPRTAANATTDTAGYQRAVPDYVHTLMNLNPLVGIIAFFRAAVLGGTLPWVSLGWSALGSAVMFIVGCLYFRHVEDSFADII
jgi:lipopolysaccharide transport system permease protein